MPTENQFNNREEFLKSLRDYFAAKAMEGMIMTQTYNDDAIAKYAYKIADAMLKAREE